MSRGELSPVFFGSALTNFGVETFLKHFSADDHIPAARKADAGEIDPMREDFSALFLRFRPT